MGFTRTEIRVEVVGAEAATRSLKGVAVAEEQIHTTGTQAAKGLTQVEVATTRAGAASAIASDKARKLKEEINAVAMPANGARVAMEGLGKGLTFLQKAAAILPGFGIAGLLLEIGRAASWLSDQFVAGEKSTALQSATLAEYTRVVNEATKAVRELGRAQAEAGRSRIGGALGIDPRALSGGARIEGAQLEAERARLDAAQKTLDTQAGEIAAAERSVRERGAALSASAANGVQPGMFGTAASLEAEARAIGERRRMLVAEAEKLRGAEIGLESKVEGLRRAAGLSDSQKTGGGRGGGRAETMPKAAGPNVNGIWSLAPAAGEDVSPQGIQNVISLDAWKAKRAADAKAIADQEMADFRLVTDQRNAMMAAHLQAGDGGQPAGDGGQPAGDNKQPTNNNKQPAIPSLYAMLTANEDEKAAFDQQMADASAGMRAVYAETQRLADEGTGMLAGLGRGLSTAAAASLLTGKSFKQAANDLLKSLAVQAAGQAIWETALGVGSLAMAAMGNPAAAASAGLHFKAAGMFAGMSVAFAGGAGLTGGMRGGGGSAGGGSGGGMASAAGTNPYRSESSAPQPIHIHIGSETVTRVVDGERRREARRDGISARAEAA